MKTFEKFLIGALALLVAVSCNDDDNDSVFDDSYYASQASISSSDSQFVGTSTGGTITFGVDGGQVVVYVDCGTDWTATNSSPDWLSVAANSNSGSVTVSAGQSTSTEQLTATVTLATANEGIKFAEISVIQEPHEIVTISVGTDAVNFPAVGALSTEITVTANADWTVETDAQWLTTETTDTGIMLTAEENEDTEERSAELVFNCTDGISSASTTVTVTQDGKAYITVSSDNLAFTGFEDEETIEIESNYRISYSYSSAPWLTVDQSATGMKLSVSENDGDESREVTITLTAGDGEENVAEAEITVSQLSIKAIVFEFTTSESDTTITLPLATSVNCTVDWGDGSEIETVTSTYPVHTFAEAGVYNVSVMGTVTAIACSSNTDYNSTKTCLTGLKQWGQTGLTSIAGCCYECENLKYLPKYTGSSLHDVSSNFLGMDMSVLEAFAFCDSLESIPEDLFADCPDVFQPNGVFVYCKSLKEIPTGLFKGCSRFEWMLETFMGCESLTSIPAGLFDDCTKLTEVRYAFAGCTSLAGESPYTVVDGDKVHLYERSDANGFTAVTLYEGCFLDCAGLSDYDSMPEDWRTGEYPEL